MAWLTDWSYRKSITLSRASGAVTDYQMKLLVGESSGATGEDVDCGGHCLSTFDDIRFTTSDGETLLDYWIESISGTTPNQLATIWIEFDSIGTAATTFYMYYGNAAAAAYSNIANTFVFGDDFVRADNAVVGNSWTEIQDKWSIDTNRLKGLATNNPSGGQACVHAVTFSGKMMVEARMKRNTATQVSFWLDGWDNVNTHNWAVGLNESTQHTYLDNSGWHPSGTASADTYYILGMMIDNDADTANYYVDRTTTLATGKTYYTRSATRSHSINFDMYWISGAPTCYVDWVIVRKWDSTEPTWGSWGSEEVSGGSTELEDAALYLAAAVRAPVRITQDALEILSDDPCSHNIRITQDALEILSDDPCSHNIRVTQGALEILSYEYVTSVADDAKLELSAYYQELEDARLYLNAAALAPLEDAALWLRTHDGTEFLDAALYLETQANELENALLLLYAAGYEYDDATLYLQATDAIEYDDAALYLYVTDGVTREDCSLYLTAVADSPAAVSSVYQRLTSVISEV